MTSLRAKTLLRLTENLQTLDEVLTYCRSAQTQRDACDLMGESFWKPTLIRILGQEGEAMITARSDLVEDEDWQNFVEGLSRGVSYTYSLRNDVMNETWDTIAFPYRLLWRNDDLDNDINHHTFQVEGIVPITDQYAYLISIADYDDADGQHLYTTFIIGSFEMAARLVAAKYHLMYKRLMARYIHTRPDYLQTMIRFGDAENEIRRGHLIAPETTLPSIEEITRKIEGSVQAVDVDNDGTIKTNNIFFFEVPTAQTHHLFEHSFEIVRFRF
ncbi:MAG: hypothetical protein ACMG6E_02205, partial [Candidatus Roizmanbacteria bacterium]